MSIQNQITIESIIDNYFKWFKDNNEFFNINSFDDLFESFGDQNLDFNLDDIINYYDTDDFEELDEKDKSLRIVQAAHILYIASRLILKMSNYENKMIQKKV